MKIIKVLRKDFRAIQTLTVHSWAIIRTLTVQGWAIIRMLTIRGWPTVDPGILIMTGVIRMHCIGAITKGVFISSTIYIRNQHRAQLEVIARERIVVEGFRFIVVIC